MMTPMKEGPGFTGTWYRFYWINDSTTLRAICGGRPTEPNPSREWCGFLERADDGTRVEALDRQLAEVPALDGLSSIGTFFGESVLVFREGDVGHLVAEGRALLEPEDFFEA
jgi:hypothetical protein